MKNTPLRRPTRRVHLGLIESGEDWAHWAPYGEAAWSTLRTEIRDRIEPIRTPDGDRRPNIKPPESSTIDYRDPTGFVAVQDGLAALQRDHAELENILKQHQALTRRLITLARKHQQSTTHTDPETGRTVGTRPACTTPGCTNEVEVRRTKNGYSYVGMIQLGGLWFAKPGIDPVCGACRKRTARAS